MNFQTIVVARVRRRRVATTEGTTGGVMIGEKYYIIYYFIMFNRLLQSRNSSVLTQIGSVVIHIIWFPWFPLARGLVIYFHSSRRDSPPRRDRRSPPRRSRSPR